MPFLNELIINHRNKKREREKKKMRNDLDILVYDEINGKKSEHTQVVLVNDSKLDNKKLLLK